MADMIRPWSDQDLEGNGAYVPFFGAFGMAWDDAIAARWSSTCRPEEDAALLSRTAMEKAASRCAAADGRYRDRRR